tara:strand:+ start:722 stop:955 length:234 start_codon:yes stop_codon:yes gene_type:complete
MQKKDIEAWLQTSKPNEEIVYFSGYLAYDRQHDANLRDIASTMLNAYYRKVVVLFQKRIAYGTSTQSPVFNYIARKI